MVVNRIYQRNNGINGKRPFHGDWVQLIQAELAENGKILMNDDLFLVRQTNVQLTST